MAKKEWLPMPFQGQSAGTVPLNVSCGVGNTALLTISVYGCSFHLRSDYSALQWLHNFKKPAVQVARWFEQLAEYNYMLEHRPG